MRTNIKYRAVHILISWKSIDGNTPAWINRTGSSLPFSGLTAEMKDRKKATVLASGVTGVDGSCDLVYTTDIHKDKDLQGQSGGMLSVYNAAGEVLWAGYTRLDRKDKVLQK